MLGVNKTESSPGRLAAVCGKRPLRIFFLIISLAVGLSFSNSAETAEQAVAPKVPAQLNLNKLLYGKYCSECHGIDLRGTDKGPPFLHRVYHPGNHGDQSFYTASLKGAKAHHWKFGDMKPVQGVNRGIVASIVQYVRFVQKAVGLF